MHFDPDAAGIAPRQTSNGFTLYTSLSWTGQVIIGEVGSPPSSKTWDLSGGLSLGSISLLIEKSGSRILAAQAHHGSDDFPRPGPDQKLILLTANPMLFPPRALEAMASALSGGAEVLDLPEVQQANALHYLSQIAKAGIGDFHASLEPVL